MASKRGKSASEDATESTPSSGGTLPPVLPEHFPLSVKWLNESPVVAAVLPEIKKRLEMTRAETTRLDKALHDELTDWRPSNGEPTWGKRAVEFHERASKVFSAIKVRALHDRAENERGLVEGVAKGFEHVIHSELAVPLTHPRTEPRPYAPLSELWIEGPAGVDSGRREAAWAEDDLKTFAEAILAGVNLIALVNGLQAVRGPGSTTRNADGTIRGPDLTPIAELGGVPREPPRLGGVEWERWNYDLHRGSLEREKSRILAEIEKGPLSGALENCRRALERRKAALLSEHRTALKREGGAWGRLDPLRPTASFDHPALKFCLWSARESMVEAHGGGRGGKRNATALLARVLDALWPEFLARMPRRKRSDWLAARLLTSKLKGGEDLCPALGE